jgi:hypothetical protein
VVKVAAIAGGNGPLAACSRRRLMEARRSGDRCSGERWMQYRGAESMIKSRGLPGRLTPALDQFGELLRLVVGKGARLVCFP